MANMPRITDVLPPVLKDNVRAMDLSNTVIVGQFGENRENELVPVKTMKEAFQTFEPSTEITVENTEGDQVNEVLRFKELKDFEAERVVSQSDALTDLSVSVDVYGHLKANLGKSPKWKKVFEDPEMRQGLVELLDQLLAIVDPEGKTKGAEQEGRTQS